MVSGGRKVECRVALQPLMRMLGGAWLSPGATTSEVGANPENVKETVSRIIVRRLVFAGRGDCFAHRPETSPTIRRRPSGQFPFRRHNHQQGGMGDAGRIRDSARKPGRAVCG